MTIYQYWSKWKEEWIDFKNQPPSDGEIYLMKKYYYKIRITNLNN